MGNGKILAKLYNIYVLKTNCYHKEQDYTLSRELDCLEFLNDLANKICLSSGENKETAFLFQRISVVIQRFNSAFARLFCQGLSRPIAFPALLLTFCLKFLNPRYFGLCFFTPCALRS